MTAIRYEKDRDAIVVLTIDLPGQSANTMNVAYREAMGETLDRLEAEKDSLAGVIVTSAKKTFFAGADLNELLRASPESATDVYRQVLRIKRDLRRLEALGKPVVAAINGAALGGGWELCLACHRRIALDDPSLRVGLPEVTLGLSPGGGGVVRTVRLLGLEKALPYLLEGRTLRPDAALKAGLVHELARDRDDLLDKARQWVLGNPSARQPWEAAGYRLPGGTPADPALAPMLALAPSLLREKTGGCLPAPERILCAAVEGARVDFDTAQLIEARYFTELATGQVSKNMIGAWFQLNEIASGRTRPTTAERVRVKRLGVIGANELGTEIALLATAADIPVVLKERAQAVAEQGRQRCAARLDAQVAQGRLEARQRDTRLARIQASERDEDLVGCDLIVAAEPGGGLGASVTGPAGAVVASASVGSRLDSSAATDTERPVGLRFFEPVGANPLVEVVVQGHPGDERSLALAFDFVQQLGKTPIVVKGGGRGLYGSRLSIAYRWEGIALVGEGVPAAQVENEARGLGMAVGPLAASDAASLDAREAAGAPGEVVHPAWAVIERMTQAFQRSGKEAGAGFYDYEDGQRRRLWPELARCFGSAERPATVEEVRDRLLFAQVLEAVRCLEEGVLACAAEANVGSLLAGFPAWTGGALRFIEQYGPAAFVARADALADRRGERFRPTAGLRERVARGGSFR